MPRAADNKLTIRFVRMGQGDCTVIRCPTGEVFIIDMGSSEREPIPGSSPAEYYDPLPKLTEMLAGFNTVEGLILTHPDKDHMNRVGLLYNINATINKVYFSDQFWAYNKGAGNAIGRGYKANVLIELMCKYTGKDDFYYADWKNIRGVTFTEDEKKFSTFDPDNKVWVDKPIDPGNAVHQYTATRGVKIHDSGGCTIHLLVASLVADESSIEAEVGQEESRSAKRKKEDTQNKFEKKRDDEYYRNMRSIVTLVEFKNKQYVICGDATGVTAKFLLKQYTEVKEVEVVQSPHHGSDTHESSALDFVKRMNPRVLVVSVGRESHSQPLPRLETLQRYFDNCARLKKNEDDSAADESSFGCYYYSRDGPKDVSHTLRKGSYYDPSVKMKATIRITGWHDLLFERS